MKTDHFTNIKEKAVFWVFSVITVSLCRDCFETENTQARPKIIGLIGKLNFELLQH